MHALLFIASAIEFKYHIYAYLPIAKPSDHKKVISMISLCLNGFLKN